MKNGEIEEGPADDVGPEGCDAGQEECGVEAGEEEGVGADDFVAHDELEGAFEPGPLHTPIDAEDGMPRHDVEPHDQGIAPPFSYETVICVEDDREYVEVWQGETTARVDVGDGEWYVERGGMHEHPHFVSPPRLAFNDDGSPRERRVFTPSVVKPCFELWVASTGDERVLVRPRRERCNHYKRQVFMDPTYKPGEVGHKVLYRNCMARRSTGGAYMSLRDESIYSCDYRSPRDHASEHVQDLIDANKLRTRPDLRLIPMFGRPGEERVIEDPYAAVTKAGGGIFGGK